MPPILVVQPFQFSPVGLNCFWGREMKIRKGGTRPGVWCEPRRAERGGQSCAYQAPGMAHGDVDISDVHGDSAAADDEPWRCSPSHGYVNLSLRI